MIPPEWVILIIHSSLTPGMVGVDAGAGVAAGVFDVDEHPDARKTIIQKN